VVSDQVVVPYKFATPCVAPGGMMPRCLSECVVCRLG
jgi:hypothetical protein